MSLEETEMDPVPNPAPSEPATERSPVRSRVRGTPEIEALIQRLRSLDPPRAAIVARARARLASGALDDEAASRQAAREFLRGDAADLGA